MNLQEQVGILYAMSLLCYLYQKAIVTPIIT